MGIRQTGIPLGGALASTSLPFSFIIMVYLQLN